MDIHEASELAQQLIGRHGLDGWTFKLNNARRQLGVCREHLKRIELSRHYVFCNPREHVTDTILHEIAHALVGTNHGHDEVWKAMCVSLGCMPKSCEKDVVMPDGAWRAHCPSCQKTYAQHRRPKYFRSLYCRKCGPEKGRLRFSNNRVSYEKRAEKAAKNEAAQLMLKLF